MKPGRPSAILTIDGRRLNAAEAALVSVRVVLANTAHHWTEIVVWPRSKFANAKPGASLSIALGTADAEEDVISGAIVSISQTASAVVIEGLSATVALSQTRLSQTYISQSVADIVRDLAGSVDIDEIEASLKLEAYSLDDQRTVWAHLVELARLSGAELGSSPSGGLRFVPIRSGSATRKFRYGADVRGWEIASGKVAAALEAAPYGAGSEAGQQKWHWILHDPLGSSSKPSRVVGAFRTRDAADTLTKSFKARAQRAALRGRLSLVGESKVRPGEIVEISDLPGNNPGPLRVLEVHHTLNANGFLTQLAVEGSGGGLGLSL